MLLCPISSLLLSLLLLLIAAIFATTATATMIGVTYTPSVNLPSPEDVANTVRSLKISAVRIVEPTPAAVRAFCYSNITLLLSVPNYLIFPFAANRSAASMWLLENVLPFHPRAHISLISVGIDVMAAGGYTSSDVSDPSTALLPAMRNLNLALHDLGIRNIAVSTTFSFINIMTTSFPPSSAEFQEPVNDVIIKPLLQFLEETNSSFLINLYPYKLYRVAAEIPIGFTLFQEQPFNYRDDVVTGVRYRNLFDMMVDAVIASLAISGHENLPVIVAETGWPCSGASLGGEAEASHLYAEMYLRGLISHLRSGLGTPLRKEGAAEAYIYQLFDEGGYEMKKNGSEMRQQQLQLPSQHWGIMYSNMSMKYKIDFSGTQRICSLLLLHKLKLLGFFSLQILFHFV